MKGVEHAMRPQIKVEAVSADAMSWLFEDPFNPPALGDEGFDEERRMPFGCNWREWGAFVIPCTAIL